ncbi:MAG: ABC transporter permease [Bacteroidaceae bacterium]|nr:ABC transporter permease [Bacteroidaceae bacterium]
MSLVWKLMRRHISLGQLAGFFFANLCGMVIVLLSIQFYQDVAPVFTEGDSFMKKDYLIVSKKVSTLGSFVGKSSTFSQTDITEIKEQPFTKGVGVFTPSQFKVSAGVGMEQVGLKMSTAMFFESVPDKYVDVNLDEWHFEPGQETVPIIIPRNYLNLYNFGFAQSRSLPQLSEGVMNLINLEVRISGGGRQNTYKGKIAGFSNRLNTILVPESFMTWANANYTDNGSLREPSRLIVEVNNPTDDRIARFFRERGYETEGDKLDAGKTTWFLKVIVGIVLAVGLLISVLSFYILMLSIYLLLQKNTTKLENLLLIGYGPNRVALPYQLLTIGLNVLVLVLAVGVVLYVRTLYIDMIEQMFPALGGGNYGWMIAVGVLIFVAVSVFNVLAVRKKVASIWMHKG